jgi:hypothetical protein
MLPVIVILALLLVLWLWKWQPNLPAPVVSPVAPAVTVPAPIPAAALPLAGTEQTSTIPKTLKTLSINPLRYAFETAKGTGWYVGIDPSPLPHF